MSRSEGPLGDGHVNIYFRHQNSEQSLKPITTWCQILTCDSTKDIVSLATAAWKNKQARFCHGSRDHMHQIPLIPGRPELLDIQQYTPASCATQISIVPLSCQTLAVDLVKHSLSVSALDDPLGCGSNAQQRPRFLNCLNFVNPKKITSCHIIVSSIQVGRSVCESNVAYI